MTLAMNLNTVLVVANLLLLTGLLVMYGGLLRQARTRLTWALLLFALLLWFQNSVQLYFFATMMKLYAGDVEWLILVQNALATVASSLLILGTWRPGVAGAARPTP